MSKIPIEIFCKNWESGNGVQCLIDNKGTVIEVHFNPNGGISVDWISAEWLEKQNKLSKNEKLTPKEGQHVHVFFKTR